MLSPMKGPIAAIVIGCTLFAVACAEDAADTDSPIDPIIGFDSGLPPVVDSGVATEAAIPVTNPAEAGVVKDGGGIVLQDASKPLDSSTDAAPVVADAGGAGDGAVGSDAGPSTDGGAGTGACCPDGKCLCHGPEPKALTSDKGPYKTASYTIAGAGCVFYPTDAEPPYAAVAVSDGFLGAGGCGSFQTGQWGPLYASWGIVAMIIDTGSSDPPDVRGQKLGKAIAAFKTENTKSASPLNGKLAGRYGTSGFSMGGGGTTYAARDDKTLLTDVAIMPWGPVNSGVTVPTLIICGSTDGTAPCDSHGAPAYRGIANTVPKMRVQISSGHAGQPSSGSGKSGQYGLAFQKVFLEGDLRWRPLLVGATSLETNIK